MYALKNNYRRLKYYRSIAAGMFLILYMH